MTRQLARSFAVVSLAVVAVVPAASASGHATAPCYDTSLPTTVEEQRLDDTRDPEQRPAAEQILAGTGFDQRVRAFRRALCETADATEAREVVKRRGTALWAASVERAQGEAEPGELPPSDDRGLYWARISMTKLLHQWAPAGGLSDADRDSLLRFFERVSRGITTSVFSSGDDVLRVVVTGFDPFTLDQDIRIGNPSGANALTLDGQQWQVDSRAVELQTMVFPVRYEDFDERMVERALRRHYRAGDRAADMVVTASQGRPNRFDLEVFNGRRRSVSSIGDNNNVQGGGTYTDPVVPPRMPRGPEFLRSSLPMRAMSQATVTPFSIFVNRRVVEIPAGETEPVVRPDGPTDGSIAVEGGGGGYLSNEIAYRNTLLRRHLWPGLPAGHLHVPVLSFGQPTEITDPTYEANREAIIDGSHRVLRKGIATLG